jgi:hypothetical protein
MMTFDELVGTIRLTIGARPPTMHLPPAVMSATSRALGVLVRDAALTMRRSRQ